MASIGDARHLRQASSSSIESLDMGGRREADRENSIDQSESEGSGEGGRATTVWGLMLKEARAVSLWTCGAFSLRFFLTILSIAAGASEAENYQELGSNEKSRWQLLLRRPAAVAAWCLLLFVPSKVATLQAPGFSFGSPWLLELVKKRIGVVPNVSYRICECYMGRMRWRDLAAVLPLHLVCIMSTAILIQRSMPSSIVDIMLHPVPYAGYNGEMLSMSVVRDITRETLATAAFVVSLLVIPVLLELNRLPTRWILPYLMYPLYSLSVEATSKTASAFAPNMIAALEILSAARGGERPPEVVLMVLGVRVLSAVLGGIVSGKVMHRYFPDDNDTSRLPKSVPKPKRQ